MIFLRNVHLYSGKEYKWAEEDSQQYCTTYHKQIRILAKLQECESFFLYAIKDQR